VVLFHTGLYTSTCSGASRFAGELPLGAYWNVHPTEEKEDALPTAQKRTPTDDIAPTAKGLASVHERQKAKRSDRNEGNKKTDPRDK
jgi:hypothetical protein